MDSVLNSLQRLMCHKTQQNNQPTNIFKRFLDHKKKNSLLQSIVVLMCSTIMKDGQKYLAYKITDFVVYSKEG